LGNRNNRYLIYLVLIINHNNEQIKRISGMLDDVSKEAFIKGGGTEKEYNTWWKKRNRININ